MMSLYLNLDNKGRDCREPTPVPTSELSYLGFNTGQQLQQKTMSFIENSGKSQHGKSYRSQETPMLKIKCDSTFKETGLIQFTIIFFTMFANMLSEILSSVTGWGSLSLLQGASETTPQQGLERQRPAFHKQVSSNSFCIESLFI